MTGPIVSQTRPPDAKSGGKFLGHLLAIEKIESKKQIRPLRLKFPWKGANSMYRLFIGIVLGIVVTVSAHASGPWPTTVKIAKAFVPVGFDDNDNVQIVVAGILPDTCYRLGPSKFEVDEGKSVVFVEQNAFVQKGPCLDVIIPYSFVYDLGVVKQGKYRIVDKTSSNELGTLTITRATSEKMDDFLYMPLTDARIHKTAGIEKPSVTLEGKLTNRCTKFDRAIVNYYPEKDPDVIVIQPIAKHDAGERCETEFRHYQITIPLREGLSHAKLLHVRSMDGKAVNKVVDFDYLEK